MQSFEHVIRLNSFSVTLCLLKPFPHREGSQLDEFLHYLKHKTKMSDRNRKGSNEKLVIIVDYYIKSSVHKNS